jgi:hypothetical protein
MSDVTDFEEDVRRLTHELRASAARVPLRRSMPDFGSTGLDRRERHYAVELLVAVVIAAVVVTLILAIPRPMPAALTPVGHTPPAVSLPTTDGPSTFFSVPAGSLSALSVYDWGGDLIGHGSAAVPLECCTVTQSPDGSVLEVGTSTGSVVMGRFGNLEEKLTKPPLGGVWAEDDVHSCVIEEDGPNSADGTLYVVGPGSQSREVVTLRGFGPHEGTSVLICNVAGNYALLETSFIGEVQALIKVRLSDGTTIWQQRASAPKSACAPSQVVSQSDTFEASVGSTTQGAVCDLATGRVVAHLDGQPLAISWNGHVVVELLSSPPNSFALEAVDWQTGAVLWRNQSAAERDGFVANVETQDEPNADAIALTTVPNPGADASQELAELWLIRPGHSALELSSQAEPGAI